MVTFNENKEINLPYDKQQYINFYDEDLISEIDWFGFSLQLKESKKNNFIESLDVLESTFKMIVSKYDQGAFWIISHEDKDFDWFFNNDDDLKSIRDLFKENNVLNSFRGSLFCYKDELFKLSRDLISYPFILSYKNLDISHNSLPLIIKITGHLTIDILSTDFKLLTEIYNISSLNGLNKVTYRGSEDLL